VRRIRWVLLAFNLALIAAAAQLASAQQSQAQFEVIRSGQFPERVIRSVTDATAASLRYLAAIEISLQGTFRIVLYDSADSFKNALVERGLRGPWWPIGQPFPGSFHLDMTRMRETDIPWFVSHELFHVAQFQLLGITGETHVNHPRNRALSPFMMEGTAEVFKLKTLEQMGITRYSAEARRLIGVARTIQTDCRTDPTVSYTRWYDLINRCGSRPIYDQAVVMFAYLFDNHGGWPKVIQYLSVDNPPDANARFATAYGMTLEAFAGEFSAFLGR